MESKQPQKLMNTHKKEYVAPFAVLVLLAAATAYGVYSWYQTQNLLQKLSSAEEKAVGLEEQNKYLLDTSEKYNSNIKNSGSANLSSAPPNGFVDYKNQNLGLSFAYPEEWGKVTLRNDKNAIKGEEYYLGFSNNKSVVAELSTPDYRYNPNGGEAGYYGPGFTDYETAVSNAKQYSLVLKETENYLLVAGLNCVGFTHQTTALVDFKKSAFSGVGFRYEKDLQNGNAVCNSGNANAGAYTEQDVVNKLTQVAETVEESR